MGKLVVFRQIERIELYDACLCSVIRGLTVLCGCCNVKQTNHLKLNKKGIKICIKH